MVALEATKLIWLASTLGPTPIAKIITPAPLTPATTAEKVLVFTLFKPSVSKIKILCTPGLPLALTSCVANWRPQPMQVEPPNWITAFIALMKDCWIKVMWMLNLAVPEN